VTWHAGRTTGTTVRIGRAEREEMLGKDGRGRRYWDARHPSERRMLADIARDHPDWSDQEVVARLRFEQSGPAAR